MHRPHAIPPTLSKPYIHYELVDDDSIIPQTLILRVSYTPRYPVSRAPYVEDVHIEDVESIRFEDGELSHWIPKKSVERVRVRFGGCEEIESACVRHVRETVA